MDNELKPCPFCGGAAEIEETDSLDIHGYIIGKKYRAQCDNVPNCFYPFTSWESKKADAVALWNKRAT
jgi:hypothetical protein